MKKLLLLVLSAVAANAATISLNDTSPVQQGSSFDIKVQATNVVAGLDPAAMTARSPRPISKSSPEPPGSPHPRSTGASSNE